MQKNHAGMYPTWFNKLLLAFNSSSPADTSLQFIDLHLLLDRSSLTGDDV
ncbi:hypothetical protein [Clostridium puniceum]|nr:hypothetical protein [Clostridium puniceum]